MRTKWGHGPGERGVGWGGWDRGWVGDRQRLTLPGASLYSVQLMLECMTYIHSEHEHVRVTSDIFNIFHSAHLYWILWIVEIRISRADLTKYCTMHLFLVGVIVATAVEAVWVSFGLKR